MLKFQSYCKKFLGKNKGERVSPWNAQMCAPFFSFGQHRRTSSSSSELSTSLSAAAPFITILIAVACTNGRKKESTLSFPRFRHQPEEPPLQVKCYKQRMMVQT
jgi:hypothetical protein